MAALACGLALIGALAPLARAEAPAVIEYGFAPLPQATGVQGSGFPRVQLDLLKPSIRRKLEAEGPGGAQLALVATSSQLGAPSLRAQAPLEAGGGGSSFALLWIGVALIAASALLAALVLSRRRRPGEGEAGAASAGAIRVLVLVGIVVVVVALIAGNSGGDGTPSAPRSFFGIDPQTALSRSETARMQRGGIGSVRLPVQWSTIEAAAGEFNWQPLDEAIEATAASHLEVLPFLYSTPGWVAGEPTTLPVDSPSQRLAWEEFLEAAVRRYGPDGGFWREHDAGSARPLPKIPIRTWQIWNEENYFYFAYPASPSRYAKLLAVSAPAIKAVDPKAQVIIGGLFGRPNKAPPQAMLASRFLDRLYREPGVKADFDGVALHPYAPDTTDLQLIVEEVREATERHGDGQTPLYVTEMGWGSQGKGGSGFEVGLEGQAEQLTSAYEFLLANRARLGLKRVYWFTWKDLAGACNFCDSVGLFYEGEGLRPKPAWDAFVDVTGGHP